MTRVFPYALLLLLLGCAQTVFSQKYEKDSLRKVLATYELREGHETDTNYLFTLNTYAYYHWSSSPDSVILLSNKGYALSEKANYRFGIITALTNLGTGYFEKGDYFEAIRIEKEGVDRATKLGDPVSVAVLYQNMSMAYTGLGKYADAMEVTLKALAIAEKNSDLRKVGDNYINLALIFADQGNFDEAFKYFEKCIELNKQLKDEDQLIWIYLNMGFIHAERKNYDQAESFFNESIDLSQKLGSWAGLSNGKSALGSLLVSINKPNQALNHFLEAKKIQEGIGNKADMGNLLYNMALCYSALGQYDAALFNAEESFNLAIETANLSMKRDAQSVLSDIYKKQHQFEKALMHHELFKAYSDSLTNEASDNKVVRLEEQYKYTQKEAELNAEHEKQQATQRMWVYIFAIGFVFLGILTFLLLKAIRVKRRTNHILRENTDKINRQKEELEAMGAFKDRLLSVVSHDVRGPLNSLKGVFDLINRQVLSKEEIGSMMASVSDKVNQVTSFVNDLLLWAKTQMTNAEAKASRFELKSTIDKTIELLKPIAERKKVSLKSDRQQFAEIEADEEMIKIVIRNLVSNAIKFCNENDVVEVSSNIERSENKVIVSVRDSGVGIPPEKISELFVSPYLSSQGTNHEIGTGLGLLLSKQYVEMNHGVIGAESEEGKGSHFWFSLPLLTSA